MVSSEIKGYEDIFSDCEIESISSSISATKSSDANKTTTSGANKMLQRDDKVLEQSIQVNSKVLTKKPRDKNQEKKTIDVIKADKITSKQEDSPDDDVGILFELSHLFIEPLNRDNETYLGEYYMPSEWDVICGRGKFHNHSGNRRFRVLVSMYLPRYVEAASKEEMAAVVHKVINLVRDASPSGGFIKQDEMGKWYEVGTKVASGKVKHAFRDWMSGNLKKDAARTVSTEKRNVVAAQNRIFRSVGLSRKRSK